MPRALDLFCRAGGASEGLRRAGFEVTGVDIEPQRHYRGGTFVQGDALTFPLEGYDLIWASPPCQAHTCLRHLQKGREYPDHIAAIRERLVASGSPYIIENVVGAPLGATGSLVKLCGSMFGLATPDGRAELRRHRLFECSFLAVAPPCRHGILGVESLSVTGTGMGAGNRGKEAARRQVITVTGDRCNSSNTQRVICVVGGKAMSGGMSEPQGMRRRREAAKTISVVGETPFSGGISKERETFSVDDARAAMGIDWMVMKDLSQAIPPAYAEFLGKQALGWEPPGVQRKLF